MATMFLATVIGWFFVIMGVFMLAQFERARTVMADILEKPSLIFVAAVFTIIMGLLMVASHNIWVMGWPVIITLISWLVLIGGLMRLVCLDTVIKMGRSFLNNPLHLRILSVVYLLVGIFLLFHVYFMAE